MATRARHPEWPLSYILPIRASAPAPPELADYVRRLSRRAEVIVVDGSEPVVFAQNAEAFGPAARHVRPDPDLVTPMGKVGGVLTGVRLASHECLIVADDDVRYDEKALREVIDALGEADVVRPQNFFSPLPWHARWDTGRMLLNRLWGGDWPGTLGVRRSALRATGGYDGRAMFENLELVRSVRAAGGRERVLPGTFVRRLPCSTRHFWSQRVRQAYDEIARPGRLALQLAVLPAAVALAGRGRWRLLLAGGLAVAGLAEIGRRRAGGRRVFAAGAAALAPVWLAERAVCSWIAVGSRLLLGGVRYRGRVLRHAATPMRTLSARLSGRLRTARPDRGSRRRSA